MSLPIVTHSALMSSMTRYELIGARDVATLLGVSRATVNRWAAEGQLKPVGTVGVRGVRVFDRAAIEALAEKEQAK